MSLRPYQVEAVEFLSGRRSALLALPPGAGKTAVVSSALGAAKRVLVVAPNGVLAHWCDQLWVWDSRASMVGSGKPKKKRLDIIASMRSQGALIVNYETFRNDIEELATVQWDVVIFDESHRLKNRQSLSFKAAQRMAKQVDRLYLVTGTPVLNRADELWTSLHLMNPSAYRSFWRWAEAYFTIEYPRYRRRIVREVGRIKSAEHARLLRRDIHSKMFYRPRKEILPELPDVIETTFHVQLSRLEREAYESMLDNFWMEVGGEIVKAVNDISKQTRLRQLGSDWSVFGEAPGTKAIAAVEAVKELDGQQAIIFTAFKKTADSIASLLPDAVAYHGDVDEERRAQYKEAFIAGEIQTLVATIATLGEGVDGLQAACHNVIFVDRDWTPARNEQAIDRVNRLGQKKGVNVTHIVADETIDDVVAKALTDKADVIARVIETRAGVPT